jgi:hypothetical protein
MGCDDRINLPIYVPCVATARRRIGDRRKTRRSVVHPAMRLIVTELLYFFLHTLGGLPVTLLAENRNAEVPSCIIAKQIIKHLTLHIYIYITWRCQADQPEKRLDKIANYTVFAYRAVHGGIGSGLHRILNSAVRIAPTLL